MVNPVRRRGPVRTLLAHHIDLDGLYPSVLANLQHHLTFNRVIPFNYDEVTEELVMTFAEYKIIYIVDISLPYESLEMLLNYGCEVILLDHHLSAYDGKDEEKGLKHLKHPNFEYVFDDEKSGTKIFYDYLLEKSWIKTTGAIEHAVNLVDTYDRWVSDSPLWEEAQNLNRIFWGLQKYYLQGIERYAEFVEDMTDKLSETNVPFAFNFYEKDIIQDTLLKEKRILKESLATSQIRTDERGKSFMVISLSSKASVTAHSILLMHPEISYLAIVNTYSNYKISFRSKGFNLLQLKGVKGHAEAAGSDHDLYTDEYCRRFLKRKMSISYLTLEPKVRR